MLSTNTGVEEERDKQHAVLMPCHAATTQLRPPLSPAFLPSRIRFLAHTLAVYCSDYNDDPLYVHTSSLLTFGFFSQEELVA